MWFIANGSKKPNGCSALQSYGWVEFVALYNHVVSQAYTLNKEKIKLKNLKYNLNWMSSTFTPLWSQKHGKSNHPS